MMKNTKRQLYYGKVAEKKDKKTNTQSVATTLYTNHVFIFVLE